MAIPACRRLCAALLIIAPALLSPLSARADFFDDARKTFQTDIPHFFQDDVPCAFGGKPTSHTRTDCKSSAPPPGKNQTHTQPAGAKPPPAQ